MAAAASPVDITKYTGKWKPNISKSDDFEPFLAEVGVPWLVRKAIKRSTPITELVVSGTTFRAVVNSGSGKPNEGTFGEVREPLGARQRYWHHAERPAHDCISASWIGLHVTAARGAAGPWPTHANARARVRPLNWAFWFPGFAVRVRRRLTGTPRGARAKSSLSCRQKVREKHATLRAIGVHHVFCCESSVAALERAVAAPRVRPRLP